MVLAGKVVARGGLAVGAMLLLGAGAAALAGAPDFGGLALWAAVVAGYGLFWIALAVLVNTVRLRAATNAVVLAGIWLALVAVIPAIAQAAVTAAVPVPSRIEAINLANQADQALKVNVSGAIKDYEEATRLDPTNAALRRS